VERDQKNWLVIKGSVLGGLVIAAGAYLACHSWKLPLVLPLDTSESLQSLAQSFTALLAWLFAVALLVERAVEVIVMVFRDEAADLLDQEEDRLGRKLKTATDNVAAVDKRVVPPTPAERDAAATEVQTLQKQLDEAEKNTIVYRAETKKVALLISFVFGMAVSFAGINALSTVISGPSNLNDGSPSLFKFVDILVTGAMIAGGSEGIHRMANAFTSVMDSLSARADQTQKNLKANP
jgi:hypothetical protein